MEEKKDNASKTRIAAVGDIHIHDTDEGKWADYFKDISGKVDVFLLVGDLTDTGKMSEAETLIKELENCTIPVLAVLGNHDYDNQLQDELKAFFTQHNIQILDGGHIVIYNVGFAGVKGFGGGFDKHMLGFFGEDFFKDWVEEAVNEALKLDNALSRLDNEHADLKKVVLLHYDPIAEIIKGEPEQIFPFLGSFRLAEPLYRRKVVAAFHGHAHIGTLEGETSEGVKVYNVSKPILQKHGYALPFFILEV